MLQVCVHCLLRGDYWGTDTVRQGIKMQVTPKLTMPSNVTRVLATILDCCCSRLSSTSHFPRLLLCTAVVSEVVAAYRDTLKLRLSWSNIDTGSKASWLTMVKFNVAVELYPRIIGLEKVTSSTESSISITKKQINGNTTYFAHKCIYMYSPVCMNAFLIQNNCL